MFKRDEERVSTCIGWVTDTECLHAKRNWSTSLHLDDGATLREPAHLIQYESWSKNSKVMGRDIILPQNGNAYTRSGICICGHANSVEGHTDRKSVV